MQQYLPGMIGWDALAIYSETNAGFAAASEAIYANGILVSEGGSIAIIRPDEEPVVIYREAGLPEPEVIKPDVVLSETGSQTTQVAAPVVSTAEADPAPVPQNNTSGLTSTERLILIAILFLFVIAAVVALVRLAWRARS
jgi:hypothetical protein